MPSLTAAWAIADSAIAPFDRVDNSIVTFSVLETRVGRPSSVSQRSPGGSVD